MPDNLYGLINEGKLLDCKGIIVDGNAQFNNSAFFLTSNNLVAFDEANVLYTSNSNVQFDSNYVNFNLPLSNIYIYGGNSGQVLTTDGTGNLSWSDGGGGGNASFIANGTSNVSIPSANGNVNISVAGNANIVTISGSEFRVNNKTANLGNIANVRIGGGSNGSTLMTYGNGVVHYNTTDGEAYIIGRPAANTVTLPVYANSTTTRNIPLIYVGNTISDPWPYANGSVVANAIPPGYNINSTAAWTPATSATLFIPRTTASYDGWFKVIESNLSNSSWGGIAPILFNELTITAYSNTGNATIQLVSYLSDGTNDQLQTAELTSHTITEFPNPTNITFNKAVSCPTNVDKTGYYIRNITANTEVTVVAAALNLIQGQ